ncbi:MAG: glycoside hydrolase family 2 TIM barrel-domain containing protein [Aminipila sp.]
MRKLQLNHNWVFWKVGQEAHTQAVSLPHDAMLAEERGNQNLGGANISWFAGGDYIYERTLSWPMAETSVAPIQEEFSGERAVLEFEGVYRNAEVFVNGVKAGERPYGYTNFYIDVTELLKLGDNKLRVVAHNSQQPNSRWYSGSGIYRPVNLCLLPRRHILLNGVKIETLEIENPSIQIRVATSAPGYLNIEVLKKGSSVVLYSAETETNGRAELTLQLPGAELWSPENPALYACRVRFMEDAVDVSFGIRKVHVSPQEGFCLNGRRVILRGGCIHSDNGILGAVAEPFAEWRKVELLKSAGYNAIRSAHNPCSKELLEACDHLGMLLMDEYVDMWYTHKTKYDYAADFDAWWRQDLLDMVDKDYNHPCVVMYSIGNEVSETSQKRGIALTREMTSYLEEKDGTRPVTCGINIFFNYLFSLGFGVYSDRKAEKSAGKPDLKNSVGSQFFNDIAGLLGAKFMKFGATLRGSNLKTRDAYAALHVAGYNYGIKRYKRDLKKYPKRVILGSETFCADSYTFYELAKQYPALIGDFVWAGMDYLGEAGVGAWEYPEYAPDFSHGPGWITAGSGRLDITGQGGGEMLYTRVAFELDPIHMAVVPVRKDGKKHSPSAWKKTNAIPSWSFHGMEGRPSTVEVYTRAQRVVLHLNGRKVGEKHFSGDCRFVFHTRYQPGKLEAKAYDRDNQEIASTVLLTAGEEARLSLVPERESVYPEGLCYVHIRYTDKAGVLKPLCRGRVEVSVENGTLLGLGNGCSYNPDGYRNNNTDTYYGRALAVIRPGPSGDVIIKAHSPLGAASSRVRILTKG